jgi:ABC-type sugar transport system permease subunit
MSTRSDKRDAAILLLPAVLVLMLFVMWPLARAIAWSLSNADLLEPDNARFVGMANYLDLLGDDRFLRALWNTALFALMVVPVQTIAAFFLALLVDRKEAGWRHLRAVFFLGLVVSMPVLAIVWTMLYQPAEGRTMGPINAVLSWGGLSPRAWLASPRLALPSLAVMSIWQGIGLQLLVFLAGLQGISPELMDAARVDGAGRLARLRHVILPAMKNSIAFNVVITTILAFRLFVQPYLMTHGGPDDRTLSLIQWVYEATFLQHDLGRASAGSVLFLILVASLTLAQRLVLREERQ